jgi:hypothetical protein
MSGVEEGGGEPSSGNTPDKKSSAGSLPSEPSWLGRKPRDTLRHAAIRGLLSTTALIASSKNTLPIKMFGFGVFPA